MVREHHAEYESQWGAITSIAGKIGCAAETLLLWVRRAERDGCWNRSGTYPQRSMRSSLPHSRPHPLRLEHSNKRVSDKLGAIQR